MTPNEREIILDYVTDKIDKQEFLRQYPVDISRNSSYILDAINEAISLKNGSNLECAMLLGFKVGFPQGSVEVLCHLLEENWHHQHEDIASLLEEQKNPACVDLLFKAISMRFPYLEYNDSTSFAIKCVWAIGETGTTESAEKLKIIADSDNREEVRKEATHQLERLANRRLKQ